MGNPFIIYNDDTCSLRFVDPPHAPDQIDRAVRHFAYSQVKAFCWCLTAGDIAYSWPAKLVENYYDRIEALRSNANARVAGGDEYDRLHTGENPRDLILSLHRRGIDYLPVLIEQTRKLGIKFYGSFRMNDSHHRSTPGGLFASKFWQEHQDWRLWDVTDGRTYYNATLDYSQPEVRQRRLDMIRDAVGAYDFDGIEIDFCRNEFTFPRDEAWEMRRMLSEFIRQIRGELDRAGNRWGRRIEMIMRVPFSEEKLRHAGMDVREWVSQEMIDALVMSAHVNDYDQSLEPWLSLCRQHGVPFYPSVEVGPAHNAAHNHVVPESIDQTARRMRGMAQNFIGQGAADGVYMFNYPCVLNETRRTPAELIELRRVLSDIGGQETLSGKPKQYTFWKNLPMQVESRRPAKYHQTIHFHVFDPDLKTQDTKVQLSFRQATEPNPHIDARHFDKPNDVLPPGWVTYWLNGEQVPEAWIRREPQPAGKIASGLTLPAHEKITISPPASAMKVGQNTLGFFVPRFPEEHDPYIHIYELVVDVN